MHRYIRGLTLAAAAGVLWGCGDDPLANGAGEGNKLVAGPAAIFMDAGDTKSTTVEFIDQLGGAREATFELGAVDAGISVVRDESFVPVFDENGVLIAPTSPTRVRYSVTAGGTPGDFAFEVLAGGQSLEIPVRVLPIELTGALSSATVSCNDGIVYTVAPPVGFATTAAVETDLGAAVNVSVSEDGRSITFFPEPGSTGTFDVAGTTVDFLPGVVVGAPLGSVEEIVSVDADCDQGTGPQDPDTAPLFTNGFLDGYITAGGADILGGGGPNKFYKITVLEDASYNLQMNWPNDADLDFYVIDPTFSEFVSTDGATGANPELVEELHLAPGEYYIAVVHFDGTAPDYFKFNFVEFVEE